MTLIPSFCFILLFPFVTPPLKTYPPNKIGINNVI